MIQTKRALVITAIAVVAVMAGIVSAISFSTPVHGQATVGKGGTCGGPNKGCAIVITTPSANPAGPNTNVITHNTGTAPQGPGASVISKSCGTSSGGNECTGGVFTPSGNENVHFHNATSAHATSP